MKIELRDPAELTVHPVLRAVPELDKEDPRFIALVEDIRERGMDVAIIGDGTGRIVDGRARWRAARRLQLREVPYVVRHDSQAAGIALGTLVARRHYTKSALAYLAWPLMEPAFEESRRRRVENLKKGQQIPESGLRPLSGTAAALAEQFGIDRKVLFEAQKVHQEFARDEKRYAFETEDGVQELTLREYFEPRILRAPIGGEHESNRPLGLGAVIAGIASVRLNSGGSKHEVRQQLELFTSTVGTLFKRFSYWQTLSATEQVEALKVIRREAASMAPERAEVIAAWFETTGKEIRKEALSARRKAESAAEKSRRM